MPALQFNSWKRVARWLRVVVLFAPIVAFAAQPEDVQSGSLLLKTAPDAQPVEALRMQSSFRVQVTGNLARVLVSQQFSNPSDDWVEGLYVFPLSTDAAVDELVMHIGDRVIRGDIQKREKARAVYEQARSEGRQASLVDQERPNMFTTSVANIAPHTAIAVEIAYLETIPLRDGRYTLHLPLAITPRYNPRFGNDPASPVAAAAAGAANSMPGVNATPERVTSEQQQVNIEVELAPGFQVQSVASAHHSVVTTTDSLGKHVQLSGSQVPADRDFELVWTPAAVADAQGAVFAERSGDETYALLMLSPPEQDIRRAEPREVEFIIDTSGSMEGPSIEQARAALQMGIDRLTEKDRFNVIRFSSDASSLFHAPRQVSRTTRSLARDFITALSANGGTEMRPPLELAFATAPSADFLRQIVFITDGSVGNETEIVSLIRQNIGTGRLFTVGIGASPNAYFLQEAAIAGRGSYTFIAERSQVQGRMQDLFRKIESPALVDLQLQWPGAGTAELASNMPGDLYSGDPLVVLARLPALPEQGQVVTLSGRAHGAAWVRQVPISSVTAQAGVSKLWARERISALTRQRNFGCDSAEAEASIVDLALRHHLVSEFTSLVAVDETPVRPPGTEDRSEQAPTSAPAGSYWAQTTGFAKTATNAGVELLIGCACLAFAALIYLRSALPRRGWKVKGPV
jgi:Ca-activated chloride channel homolog